jgi:hypothetical protein
MKISFSLINGENLQKNSKKLLLKKNISLFQKQKHILLQNFEQFLLIDSIYIFNSLYIYYFIYYSNIDIQ